MTTLFLLKDARKNHTKLLGGTNNEKAKKY